MAYISTAEKRLGGFLLIAFLALNTSAATAATTGTPITDAGSPVVEESPAQVVSRSSDISVEIDGLVDGVSVLEGQTLSAGETLFTMDCRRIELAYNRAELALSVAEENATQANAALFRSTEGLRNSITTKVQNDLDKLAYQTAQLDVEDKRLSRDSAQLAIGRCTVTAPITGVVTKIVAGPGSYLTAGSLVLSMTETENLEVTAQLTPGEIDILGNSATLTFVSDDESFPLTVRAVEPTFDAASGTQRVHLKLPPTADLPVGLDGVLRWDGGRYSLPPEYLARRGPEVGLLIETGGSTEFRPVPGAVEGLPVIVRLPANTKVVKP